MRRQTPPGKGRGDAGWNRTASRATSNANPAIDAPRIQVPHDPAPARLRGYEAELRKITENKIERGESNPGICRRIDLIYMEHES